MIKYLLLVSLTCSSYLSADYAAKKITKVEYEKLLNIDEKLYSLAAQKHSYSFGQVSSFIYKNLAYRLDYSLLKIDSVSALRYVKNVQGVTGAYTEENSRFKSEIRVTYPFWDKKEDNERQKKIIDTKQTIITKTKKYFDLKAEYEDLKIQKLIILELENRTKSRKLTAVGGFDDWMKVIEDLRKVNKDLTKAEIELSENKQILISFVKPNFKNRLKEML